MGVNKKELEGLGFLHTLIHFCRLVANMELENKITLVTMGL